MALRAHARHLSGKSSQGRQCQSSATTASDSQISSAWPRGPHWEVHKFGGACVADAGVIAQGVSMVADCASRGISPFLVVSAMGGSPKVTDLLMQAVEDAEKRDESYLLHLSTVRERYESCAQQLLSDANGSNEDEELSRFLHCLQHDFENLKSMLQAMASAGMSAPAFRDHVVGHGEIWCAQLFAALLRSRGIASSFLDAREVLTVRESSEGQSVDVLWEESANALDQWWNKSSHVKTPHVVVATGFIAADHEGKPTTLKRNGSDYSATAFGALLQCCEITIWSDVDGVFSADPRKVPEAVALRHMSYNEAWELSYFGANVLHPRTTLPAIQDDIPITLRNFFKLDQPGTRISSLQDQASSSSDPTSRPMLNEIVKGFSTIDNVSLINVEGTGMVGVQGTAASIFGAVRDVGCNVIMISQASSEHSVCFAVKTDEASAAVAALNSSFSQAIAEGRIWRVSRVDGCTILAAVGQRMCATHGVCAMLFDALAKANVNVIAVAQGCSEYNVTTVVSENDSSKALAAVHSRFYLSETPIGIAVVGPGQIGSTLMRQIHEQSEYLRQEFNIDLRLYGVADTKRMITSTTGISLDSWQHAASEDTDIKRFTQNMLDNPLPNKVIVDCTSSHDVARCYLNWLESGIHVITSNNRANSGEFHYYASLREKQRRSYTHFFYEATVGAGLPILSTLQQLKETGDKLHRIEGVLSEPLSYIFNMWTGKSQFSEVVKQAIEEGITEQDPRDDLSGIDVARKVVILARECGMHISLEDLNIDSFVPAELENVSVDEFIHRLPEHDERMMHRLNEAKEDNCVLRFVGIIDMLQGFAEVQLRNFAKDHPFGNIQGTENILLLRSRRYSPPAQPLVIRGPGAGPEVTAGGVFGDVLRLAGFLGSPS